MRMLKQILMARVSSEKLDGTVGQAIVYLSAMAFLVLAMHKLSTLTLGEAEYFVGLLLVLGVALLLILLGMMIHLLTELNHRKERPA